jgi:mono/diheme cytochrome c family protein
MTSMKALLTSGSAIAVLLSCATLAAGSKSVWSGVYTEQQAQAGEKVYYDRCATCHGDDLGGIEKAPALTGGSFRESWHGKTLRKLLERIESMPPDEPKVVAGAEAINVLAFLLQASEMPSGSSALPDDRAQLNDIVFEQTKP